MNHEFRGGTVKTLLLLLFKIQDIQTVSGFRKRTNWPGYEREAGRRLVRGTINAAALLLYGTLGTFTANSPTPFISKHTSITLLFVDRGRLHRPPLFFSPYELDRISTTKRLVAASKSNTVL
jgi:hypothetical protein